MSSLGDLYQQVILDHNRRPRNYGRLSPSDCKAEGYNPLCGDHLSVYLNIEDETIGEVAFEGTGCAISRASASMMTENLKGRTLEQADRIFALFHSMVTGKTETNEDPDLGKLVVFSGVRQFPARVKCATLAWHTTRAAIEGRTEPVSTE